MGGLFGWVLTDVVMPLAFPVALALGYDGLKWAKMKGYRVGYAEALVRAVGEGHNRAREAGLSIYTDAGRKAAVDGGVRYMATTMAQSALKLGIDEAGHRLRVQAQMGAMEAKAEAEARAKSVTTDAFLNALSAEGLK